MRALISLLAVVGAVCGTMVALAADTDDGKPKYTIKDVMAEAHKGKLVNKVQEGAATDEEKEKLVALYIALWENKPPKGDQASWNEKSGALVVASAKALLGEEGAADALKSAANCAACHGSHKGK